MNQDSSSSIQFDFAIVGSSPLMILQAILLVGYGKKVCILEQSSQYGGAWKKIKLPDGSYSEVACHLIESFPYVYSYLEAISGVPFVPLSNKPVRVFRSGFSFPYSNKLISLLSYIRLLLGSIYYSILSNLYPSFLDQALNFRYKLSLATRFQLPSLLLDQTVKAPLFGYAHLLDKIVSRALSSGVIFYNNFKVERIASSKTCRLIFSSVNKTITASHIICSSSVQLFYNKSDNTYTSHSPVIRKRYSCVVEIAPENVRTNHSYVAFWRDKFVTRISRIDSLIPTKNFRYLVELRSNVDQSESALLTLLSRSLHKARIIFNPGDFTLLSVIEYDSITPSKLSKVFSPDHTLETISSYGNLAASISNWLSSSRHS